MNAELLIDHAWGWEPCTIEAIKAYRPETHSLSNGQVLAEPYTVAKARVVVMEMADALAQELLSKRLTCDQLTLTINYDIESLKSHDGQPAYEGELSTDYYGRTVPKHSHGSQRLPMPSSSLQLITEATTQIYDRIVKSGLYIRRLNLTVEHVVHETDVPDTPQPAQLDLFTDYDALAKDQREQKDSLEKERRLQEARLAIQQRFGKNSILRGLNFEEGATAKERNKQIGGHKA